MVDHARDPVIGGMILDLPPPVSVNETRRVNWAAQKKVSAWIDQADRYLLAAKARREVRLERIPRYELIIILSEDHVDIDADNGVKLLIDYLRHREIVADDGKKNLRRFSVEWGHAPAGVRIKIHPLPTTMKEVADRANFRA